MPQGGGLLNELLVTLLVESLARQLQENVSSLFTNKEGEESSAYGYRTKKQVLQADKPVGLYRMDNSDHHKLYRGNDHTEASEQTTGACEECRAFKPLGNLNEATLCHCPRIVRQQDN